MSDQARGEYLVSDASALALLVDAANAKSQESVRGGGNSVSSSFDSKGYRGVYKGTNVFFYFFNLHNEQIIFALQIPQSDRWRIKLLQTNIFL